MHCWEEVIGALQKRIKSFTILILSTFVVSTCLRIFDTRTSVALTKNYLALSPYRYELRQAQEVQLGISLPSLLLLRTQELPGLHEDLGKDQRLVFCCAKT